jgi:hypothetical protein
MVVPIVGMIREQRPTELKTEYNFHEPAMSALVQVAASVKVGSAAKSSVAKIVFFMASSLCCSGLRVFNQTTFIQHILSIVKNSLTFRLGAHRSESLNEVAEP